MSVNESLDPILKYNIVAEALVQAFWFAFKTNGFHMIHYQNDDGRIVTVACHGDVVDTKKINHKFTSLDEIKENEEVYDRFLEFTSDLIRDSQ